MSKTLDELFEEIKKDESLQKKLADLYQQNDKSKYEAFLADNGCDASLNEAKAFLENKSKEMQEEGELTPDQLEAVSGGVISGVIFIVCTLLAGPAAAGAGYAASHC